MPTELRKVRFQGKSGKHLLRVFSLTRFGLRNRRGGLDPEAVRHDESVLNVFYSLPNTCTARCLDASTPFLEAFGWCHGMLLVASVALAGEEEFAGNYELVSATRKILETGQTEDTFGKKPKGLAMYGSDGHFIIFHHL